jgi:thiol:disulfide interchange protein
MSVSSIRREIRFLKLYAVLSTLLFTVLIFSAFVAEERTRPRATTAYTWLDDLDGAIAAAQTSGKQVFLYFETDWCGPCKTMDQWIWTDAEVVAALEARFVGVKLDGDIAKEQVRRYEIVGYPNILIVDPASGAALRAVKGYQSSQQLLDFLRGEGHTP